MVSSNKKLNNRLEVQNGLKVKGKGLESKNKVSRALTKTMNKFRFVILMNQIIPICSNCIHMGNKTMIMPLLDDCKLKVKDGNNILTIISNDRGVDIKTANSLNSFNIVMYQKRLDNAILLCQRVCGKWARG
jgi:hypothetical protein